MSQSTRGRKNSSNHKFNYFYPNENKSFAPKNYRTAIPQTYVYKSPTLRQHFPHLINHTSRPRSDFSYKKCNVTSNYPSKTVSSLSLLNKQPAQSSNTNFIATKSACSQEHIQIAVASPGKLEMKASTSCETGVAENASEFGKNISTVDEKQKSVERNDFTCSHNTLVENGLSENFSPLNNVSESTANWVQSTKELADELSGMTLLLRAKQEKYKRAKESSSNLATSKAVDVSPNKVSKTTFKVINYSTMHEKVDLKSELEKMKATLDRDVFKHPSAMQQNTENKSGLKQEKHASERKLSSKYKIVNKKRSVSIRSPLTRNLLLNRARRSLTNQDAEENCIQFSGSCISSKPNTPVKTMPTKRESYHNSKKGFSQSNITANEKIDLDNFTPEELCTLDNKLLDQLQLLAQPTHRRNKSFVHKTKFKLSKNNSSIIKRTPVNKAIKHSLNAHSNPKPGQKILLRNGIGFPRNDMRKLNQRFRKSNYATLGALQLSRTFIKNNQFIEKRKNALAKGSPRIIAVRGIQFVMDSSGKTLKKLSNTTQEPVKRGDVTGQTCVKITPEALKKVSYTQSVASRVLNRSIQMAVAAKSKKLLSPNKYCTFYNRFGKCKRGANCKFIHDPSKIAVCTRFLRGTCKEKTCPFSHERNPGKMAICSFFLQGTCTTKDCPYRHETINPDAELCDDFVKGYCSLGDKCPKVHILVCPHYLQGKCSKGLSCLFPHPVRKEPNVENVDEIKEEDKQSVIPNEKEDVLEEESSGYFRYFIPNEEEEVVEVELAKTVPSIATVSKQNYLWGSGEDVPVLPKYIPFAFDDSECLIE